MRQQNKAQEKRKQKLKKQQRTKTTKQQRINIQYYKTKNTIHEIVNEVKFIKLNYYYYYYYYYKPADYITKYKTNSYMQPVTK